MRRISKSILAHIKYYCTIERKLRKYFLRERFIMPTQPILGDKLTLFFFVQQTLQQFQGFKNYTNTTYQIHCTSPIIASISHVQITITSVQLTFLSLDFGLCGV
jgi:hypothetical protein